MTDEKPEGLFDRLERDDQLKDLFRPSPHPPGTEVVRHRNKKRRRKAGPQHDAGWSDWKKDD